VGAGMQLESRSHRPLAARFRRQRDGQADVAIGLAYKYDGLLGGHNRCRGRLCPTDPREEDVRYDVDK